MKVLIVEDEMPAFRRLSNLLLEIDPEIEIMGHADSIEAAVKLIGETPEIDLALFDIELADGQSFDIFSRTEVKFPVIFTTAYDEFALKAFKVNSIDYLLKPIQPLELKQAIEKFKRTRSTPAIPDVNMLLQALRQSGGQSYKQRFLVKLGSKLISIASREIAYFQAQEKVVYLVSKDQKRYIVDYSIEELSGLLDPQYFFHLNRQFLASLDAIESVSTYFNGKLKIHLLPTVQEEVLVSRDKAGDFKQWLNS